MIDEEDFVLPPGFEDDDDDIDGDDGDVSLDVIENLPGNAGFAGAASFGGFDTDEEDAAPEPEPEPEPEVRRYAVLFELEHIAAAARRGAYETIKGIFESKDIDFSPVHYNRFCSFARPEHYVEELLTLCNARKLSNQKLINDIKSGVGEYLATMSADLDPTLAKIIDTAREKEMLVAALTSLPQAVYGTFANKLGLIDRGVQIFSFPEADKFFPKADSWLKVCKEIDVRPASAVGLVTTNVACKGALTAGMRVIAVPDEFTGYQDFGGAYTVLDNLEEIELDDIFSILPEETE